MPLFSLGIVLMGSTVLLSNCSKPEPESAIVQAMEQAGAGPVTAETSSDAIRDWLRKHPQAAESINSQCKPIKEKAPASWGDTTEGRICDAARTVAATSYKRLESDHETFSSGRK
jgi:hypothetical protein